MPELLPDIAPLRAATRSGAPPARLAIAALAVFPAVAALAFGLTGSGLRATCAAVAVYAAGVGVAIAALQRGHYPHATLGVCNVVTLVRLGLTSTLVAPLVADASSWAVIAVALVALALDGLDGWLARREGRESSFGARFDMEVDAALGLILAWNAWAAGTVGVWVLLLGLPRYVFLAAARPLPWLSAPLPDSFRRKAVCVLQIAALVVLQVPGLPAFAATGIAAFAALALFGSFGRDVLWLWRARS
jgi:phosphatidylglycerophosphate synthase